MSADNDAYIRSLELERTALKITVAELEEQLADLRARAEHGLDARELPHASRVVEAELRRADVCEVRLWGSAWYTGDGGARVSVTLTLRNGRGELHGGTLADALLHAREAR